MPSFRVGVVAEILGSRPGLQRARVEIDGRLEHAYVLTQLTGPVTVGDRVVCNTTAVDLGLGSGGSHVVHWNLERAVWSAPVAGNGMKLRYTSLQVDVAQSEPDEHTTVDGCPVVAAGLHSQLAGVAVAFKHLRPDATLVYVMTDAGALPIAISDLVRDLRERGLLDRTVTCGHAFGGDLEAVSLYGALPIARHVAGADAIVVAMGPGSAGSGSRLGFSGVEVGPVLDAATALEGRPIAALRASFADPRPRHRGVSHHSLTALTLATRARVTVALPSLGGPEEEQLRNDLAGAGIDGRHDVVAVDPAGIVDLFAAHDLHVESMGRPAAADPVLFEAAAAAGILAARAVG